MHDCNTLVFSVITITYNAEKVLEKTIQSVEKQRQHYPNIEYIIIDGASNDRTMEIVKRYHATMARVISEKDNGLYDAMNKGISLATGDYLCFLNAGDIFHEENTIDKVVRTLDGSEFPDIIYGETAIVNKDGEFLYMRRLKAPSSLNWKSFRNGMLVCHQAFYVKRELAEPYNLKYRFSSDFDWCIRMMKKAKTLHPTRLIVIDYMNQGLTSDNHMSSLIERFRIMIKYYGLLTTIVHHIRFVFRQF